MFESTPPQNPKDNEPSEAGNAESTGPYFIKGEPHISGIEFAGPITFNKTKKAENLSDNLQPGDNNPKKIL